MKITPQIVSLYLGQKCRTPDGIGVLCGISQDGIVKVEFGAFGPDFKVSHTLPFVKPILRRTESLTEMEARELYEIRHGKATHKWDDEYRARWEFWKADDEWVLSEQMLCTGVPAVWLKLLSWGFDLFGLIDSGAAIDAETMGKNDET